MIGIRSLERTDKEVMWSDERIDVGVLRGFGYVERMKSDKIAKRIYVG